MRPHARLIGCFLAVLTACASEPAPPAPAAHAPLRAAVHEAELSTLLAQEPDAVAADYTATTTRYRLFGVQLSQAPAPPFATLADTSTWATRNVRVGERLGRNLQVTAITAEGLELKGAGGSWRLAVGQELSLRVIRHRFDVAATHLGRHHWKVDGSAIARLHERYGLGADAERVNVLGKPALRLLRLREEGVLARLGFHEGDLLFSLDGAPLAPGDLGTLSDRMTQPGGTVRVRVYREASFQTLTFSVEGR